MRKLLIMAALAATLSANCMAGVIDVPYDFVNFSSINVGDEFEVTLSSGSDFGVVVTIDEELKDYASVVVRGSTLYVSMEEKSIPGEIKKLFNKNNVPTYSVSITCPSRIDEISLGDKAILNETHNFNAASDFILNLKDKAKVEKLYIKGSKLTVNMDNSSEAAVDFTGDRLKVSLEGHAKLDINRQVTECVVSLSNQADYTDRGKTETITLDGGSSVCASLGGTAKKADYILKNSSDINALNLVCEQAVVQMEGLCKLQQSATERIRVDLKNGATLIFNNSPQITIDKIEKSTIVPYVNTKKKK